jgi:multiple sugar transport system substrate-binding protein
MVIQATAANQGPDIVNVYSDLLPTHVAAGTLAPLDKYVATMGADNDFVVPLKFMTFDGSLRALPWESRVWLYWYRADLLAKAKQSMPATLDELGLVSGAMTTDNVMGWAFGASEAQLGANTVETFIPLLWGAGGDMLDDKGRALYNSDAGVQVVSYLRDMLTKYKAMRQSVLSMTSDDILSGVKAGTIAGTFQGTHRLSAARASAVTGDNLKAVPIPGVTAGKPTPARIASQTLGIGSSSKNPDGAWKFIQFYLSPASQLKFAKAGVMPSKASSYQDDFFASSATGKEMRGWSQYVKDYGRMETLPGDYSKLVTPLVRAVQKVLLGSSEPKAALDAAAAEYNALHP